MIFYLMKNNFKLMFRNVWSIVLMTVVPVIVIAILSSAFSEQMKSYQGIDEFTVGYRLASDSVLQDAMKTVKEIGIDNGITFHEYKDGNPEDLMKNNELAAFVEFSKDKYTLYQSSEHKLEGITIDYFLNRVMQEGVNAALQTQGAKEQSITLPIKQIDFMPAVDSTDYYGIIYIVYFAWCGLVCATGVLSNEKKYGIERKYQVTSLGNIEMYLAKFLPVTLIVCLGMAIGAGISICMYDIHWGNPVLSAVIMICSIMAACAMGLMIYSFFKNIVITIISVFTIVWFMGFAGGSFETYLFSSIPDLFKKISPIYHCNRALVELSCMGHSDYVSSTILYSLAMALICSMIAIVVETIRRRGKA
ncbi:MAG: ABC transporter permease [Eubacteriales bacterium]|nr:ABC transporter permease [Eubacteriales bacterium]